MAEKILFQEQIKGGFLPYKNKNVGEVGKLRVASQGTELGDLYSVLASLCFLHGIEHVITIPDLNSSKISQFTKK